MSRTGEIRCVMDWQPRPGTGSQAPRFQQDMEDPEDWNLYGTGGYLGTVVCPFGHVGSRLTVGRWETEVTAVRAEQRAGTWEWVAEWKAVTS